MDDTSKYLIHAAITADGVVERSDVVGAIFGQTEGLLGDDLDLRDLQQASKVGRIDVEIESEAGQSFGHVTIATSLDRVETSILAASLETITRVGPCRSEVRVTEIEDVREAKRREVVERAKELLAKSFDESIMTSSEILDEVRESVRVEDITEYEGLPAGPRVQDSDAIIVVEGRADVLTLLKYGIKNAVAVEGTNVPDAIADLTQDRTVTTFLDGDRGGELILRELVQIGDVDYVAFAPKSRSVEDLGRPEVMSALRDKVPYETFTATDQPDGFGEEPLVTPGESEPQSTPSDEPERATGSGGEARIDNGSEASTSTADAGDETGSTVAETDGAGTAAAGEVDTAGTETTTETTETANTAGTAETAGEVDDDAESAAAEAVEEADAAEKTDGVSSGGGDESDETDEPIGTLRGIARDVVGDGTGEVRLTDDSFRTVASGATDEAFDLLKEADEVPYAVFVDGEVTQRLLDVAAQRGTEHVVGRSLAEFVKRPVSVRIRTAEQLLGPRPANE
ncbi:DNA primase DnaG [Salinigranum marinum]|uniref:DNA primase DnaG n=1 Tax=Salinigranum marinum TaxID=1515595 RepID=UPI0029899FA5|nr:DNA primase DnaG [Salinigranum marinum]